MITSRDGFNWRYQCDTCGKLDAWGPEWVVYGSILIHEEDPGGEIHCCSAACMDAATRKVESGEWKLPEYQLHGYRVTLKSKGRGYGKFRKAA